MKKRWAGHEKIRPINTDESFLGELSDSIVVAAGENCTIVDKKLRNLELRETLVPFGTTNVAGRVCD
jgi:hypothetical protein